jgi:hypothetical protein
LRNGRDAVPARACARAAKHDALRALGSQRALLALRCADPGAGVPTMRSATAGAMDPLT